MIQKITHTSILPYAKLPKEFKGQAVVGYYAGYNLKKGFNLLEASVAEKIYRQRIEDIIKEGLNLHGKSPSFSLGDTRMGYKYSTDTYLLGAPDETPIESIISYLVTKHINDLNVRERYLRKGVCMPEDSSDMIAGTLQVLVSCKNPDGVKNLYDALNSLQSQGDGVVGIDSGNLSVIPFFFDVNEIRSVVRKYLMFDRKK